MRDMSSEPRIKGIFVNSHVKALEAKKGPGAVRELAKRYGARVRFRNSEDVPVREEIKIIELALDIMSDSPVPSERRAFEAGRLHFRNFSGTPLARIIFSMFRTDFKLMMMQAPNIAGHVFKGVKFASADLGPKAVKVTMDNNDYPMDHFRGLFQEWLEFSGKTGHVTAQETSGSYAYAMKWR
jgi:uncharacterized protein (TIGR02265 family)